MNKEDEQIVKQIAADTFKELNLKSQYDVPNVADHHHTGIDSTKISFTDLLNRSLPIHWTVVGTSAATATNYGVFWTAPFPCLVTGFSEVHMTAATDVGAVTLQLERLQGTEALDAGDSLLSTALSLKSTANTVQYGAMIPTLLTRNLAVGDRLALKDAGTLTAVANVSVIVNILY